ncbi:DUF5805 domain-containing protein [Halobellus captivus]|uniref:DUF5805 domain-containing protein n=1 Tax=Halobellus captivus TaxID=2592614 RepID=UPI00119F782F|nr:DUF5805 domain-containing protein [Halobellus captivus]
MSAEESTERKTVMTYVPGYQKERWRAHAEELGMSQSEYVRTMVQAGRREFEIPSAPGSEHENGASPEGGLTDGTPGVQARKSGLQNQVLDVLSSSTYCSWDDLLAALTDDIEDRLDDTLQEMQSADEIRYSGRHDGYTLSADDTTGP